MLAKTKLPVKIEEVQEPCDHGSPDQEAVLRFKKRMLEWPNPVEYVNNMYGCHPDDDDNEYFRVIFSE
jgi:hypothetical protein